MPCWYYEKKEIRNSPSAADGIDFETESRYRREGARFIIDTGTKMDLGYNTMATGVVYFHRFYMFHSFRTFPRYVTACCCLFLAGKVEETPKKCKDIIKTARSLLTDAKFATFGEDPKEEVMTLERILLQTIKFDLQVEHPYSYLLRYAKCLKGDKQKLQKMVQMAWTFVNDSLCTTLALQWEPEVIAVALMYLAGKLSKFEVVDWVGRTSRHLRWWDMFVEDITMDLLEDICHQVLDLYSTTSTNPAPDSPPLPPRAPTPPANNSPLKPVGPTKTSKNGHEITPDKIPMVVEPPSAIPTVPPMITPPAKPIKVLAPEMPRFQYTYTAPPPMASYPPTFTTPIQTVVPPHLPPNAHLAGPPPVQPHMNQAPPPPHMSQPPPTSAPPGVYASFVGAPGHYPAVVGASYFTPAPVRPYYPPPT
ncbi:cyclin-K [Chrysoperla carnea]|uniref:cyclin-K n=1 Tax=Chrysoperla carnea TaxID=189513 RepID=UPI001D065A9B|nr:cyclin-K [Chrysoperla carnea]